METNIRSLTMLLCIHGTHQDQIRNHSIYRRPHNLGSLILEYILKCRESEVSMSDSYSWIGDQVSAHEKSIS